MFLAASNGGSGAFGLFWLVLIGLVFFFLVIRPQRSRQRQALQVRQSLAPGAQVQTTFGLLARVVAVEDNVVVLEVAPGVHSRYLPAAVARIVTPADPAVQPAQDRPEEPALSDTGGGMRQDRPQR